MTRLSCAACNSPLEESRPRYMQCTNSHCPAGGVFRKCGYCKSFSQASVEGAAECFNPACPVHHVRLAVCPDCKRYSVMSLLGAEPFCLSRDCESNAGIVQECEFCHWPSFLRADGIDLCAKSDCPALLKKIPQCAFCGRWSVDLDTDSCTNESCSQFSEEVTECDSCGRRMYSFDKNKCLNEACSLSGAGDFDAEMTLAPSDALPTPIAPAPAPEIEATLVSDDEITKRTTAPPGVRTPAYNPPPEEIDLSEVGAEDSVPALKIPSPPLREPDPPRGDPSPPTESGGFRAPPTFGKPPTPNKRSGARSGSPQIDIADAFRAVREGLLATGDGGYCPLLLVMGTAGSGKTAFLATLGKILNAGSSLFAFPHPGVAAEPIRWDALVDLMRGEYPNAEARDLKKELKARIEDLVFTYSSQIYDQYIARGIWCEFTRPDFGQFLVANVTRQGHPLANIVTLETSGENFESLLGSIHDLGELAHTGTPIVRTMAEMLNHAQGLIIVMDPSASTNDRIYQPFFTHLSRHLGHRVHTTLDREIRAYKERNAGQKPQRSGGKERISQFHREGAHEAAQRELEELTASLARLGALAIERDRPRYQSALDAITKGNREVGANIQAKLDQGGGDPTLEVEIWTMVLNKAAEHVGDMADVLFPEVARSESELTISSEQALARQLCVKYGVPAEVSKHFNLEAGPASIDPQFPHLRDIALVCSKSDMHPAVYPPDGYPRQKLPAACAAIEQSEHFLRFLGGELRYYNTSVLGYSASGNGQFYPGNEASLTPVNVIEPVFDMLSDKLNGR